MFLIPQLKIYSSSLQDDLSLTNKKLLQVKEAIQSLLLKCG